MALITQNFKNRPFICKWNHTTLLIYFLLIHKDTSSHIPDTHFNQGAISMGVHPKHVYADGKRTGNHQVRHLLQLEIHYLDLYL